MYSEEKGNYGKEAEIVALKYLKDSGYDAVSTKEFLGEEWTPLKDAEIGDIQIFKDGELWKSVDVKRADNNQPLKFVGTVTKSKGSESFRNNPNAWYLLYNKNLSKRVWVKADKLKDKTPKNGNFWTTAELLKA